MIVEQRCHEEQWQVPELCRLLHPSRSNIKRRWAGREKILSSSHQPASCHVELAAYDSKVHNALLLMQRHMGQQLSDLGVPFFGVEPSLVVDRSDENGPRVSRVKLGELQRKMLDYLESMYGPQ